MIRWARTRIIIVTGLMLIVTALINELSEMGPMRQGSLTLQYKAPAEKKGPYYQLSYTHKMKSRT